MSKEIQREKLKGLPKTPIVRIVKHETKKLTGIDYNMTDEAKDFMHELVENFIRETAKEMVEGGFLKNKKTIKSENIIQALRIPQDIVLMRHEILIECLKRVREKRKGNRSKSNI